MNELLAVSEKAWTPRDPNNDPDNLKRFRYSCITRHVFSSSTEHMPMALSTSNAARQSSCVKETFGVAGLIVRKDPKKRGAHLLYTWTDAYEGYPHENFDERGPSQVKVWRGRDGKFQKSFESMAMHGDIAVMANGGSSNVWLFNVKGNKSHEQLDRREGPQREFEDEREAEEESGRWFAGRHLVAGQVKFPLWGGNPPAKAKKKEEEKQASRFRDLFLLDSRDDLLGEGGPMVLAIQGKWLVAGFAYGGIVRAPLLPDEYDYSSSGSQRGSSDGLVSCSSLPSDEWFCPVLEADGDDEDET